MNKTIFYVDDEPWFVDALIDALRTEGYIVELATTGTDAINRLKQEGFSPDLVILDVIMPNGDKLHDTNGGRRTGIRIHEIMRKQIGSKMPIIFLTVVDDPSLEREIEAIEKGIGIKKFGYLVKPVLPTELLNEVERLLFTK